MRYIDWREPAGQHPNIITNATEALQSGALFARKFDLEVWYSSLCRAWPHPAMETVCHDGYNVWRVLCYSVVDQAG